MGVGVLELLERFRSRRMPLLQLSGGGSIEVWKEKQRFWFEKVCRNLGK